MRSVNTLADRSTRLFVGTCDEHAAGAGIEQGDDDFDDLGRGLAVCQHRLRRTLSQLSMDVHTREPEVDERQLGKDVERVARLDVAPSNAL